MPRPDFDFNPTFRPTGLGVLLLQVSQPNGGLSKNLHPLWTDCFCNQTVIDLGLQGDSFWYAAWPAAWSSSLRWVLSLRQAGFGFFGIGTMVAHLSHLRTVAMLSEMLKMPAKTSFGCSAYSFKTRKGMLSGHAALRWLTLAKTVFSPAANSWNTWSLDNGRGLCVWKVFLASKHALTLFS